MTPETREKLKSDISRLQNESDLTVREMELLDGVRKAVDEEDESLGEVKAWEEKYGELEKSYKSAIEENNRILEAYRRRWDESLVGTKVNGRWVEKTVTDVDNHTYEKLLKGE